MARFRSFVERLLAIKPSNLKIGREISGGAYGVVHEGVLDGQPVAVQEVHKLLQEAKGGEDALRSFCEECERLQELDHPHVIKFCGAFTDAELGPILVMERMKESLQQFLDNHRNKLSIQDQIRISLEITQGVAFLHQLKPPMVHHDLNDRNVMFTFEGAVKIGEFGQSKLKKGMVAFMPPESLHPENPHCDESLDVFSLGVLMLEIGTQQPPILSIVGIGTTREVKRREKDLDRMDDLHPLKPFILLCLSDDRKQRPKAIELQMVLPRLKMNILQTMIAAEESFHKMEAKCEGTEQKCVILQQNLTEICEKSEEIRQNAEIMVQELKMRPDPSDVNVLIQQLIAYEEDFQADRQDRESAQDKLAEREKEWIDHLADLSQERDRLAEEISLLSKRIVEVKTEHDETMEEELSVAKSKMDRMMNALKENYHLSLKKKDEEIDALKCMADHSKHVAKRQENDKEVSANGKELLQ